MPALTVAISTNFSTTALSNIDIIDFTNLILSSATATFANTQFNNADILNDVLIDGSLGTNRIVVNGGDVNASVWTFIGWGATDTISINGNATAQNILHGSTVRDTINGGGFEDDIFGEGGADILKGGASDDAFRFTNGSQVVSGLSIDGGTQTDRIALNSGTGFDFSLATIVNVERVDFFSGTQTATFDASQLGTGKINQFVAQVGGPATINVINASTLNLSTAALTGFGASDSFVITGTGLADVITGSSASDIINGIGGADVMHGGGGDDFFVYTSNDAVGDAIDGGSGTGDALRLQQTGNFDLTGISSLTGVEKWVFAATGDQTLIASGAQLTGLTGITGDAHVNKLTLNGTSVDLSGVAFTSWTNGVDSIQINGTSGADTLAGSSQNDVIGGGDGADTLDGFTGADTMIGGLGNDIFIVDNVLDIITELSGAGSGSDFINTSVSYTMSANTERLFLTGTDNINGTGVNGQVDVLTGNSGHNILNGLTGNDVMRGGQGSDTYLVDSTSDIVEEATNAGTDSIKSTATFIMTINTERLFLLGGAAIDGTGLASKNDLIVGNNGANKLNGLTGNDELIGGLGTDTFVFTTALNAATNHDKITDFSVSDDTIQLENAIFTLLAATGTLGTGFFEANSIAGQSGSEVVIYDKINGDLYYDTNGAATAGGLVLFADVANNTALTAADFVVI